MVRKAVGQVSLVEALLPAAFGSNQRLERITGQVDWVPIETLLQSMRQAPTGRPAYPPLVQLKALLLQQWYRLSDRDLEEALADRLSFRRFCGLGLEDAVPDATTISRFRIDLAEGGLAEEVFDALNAQFEQRGLVIKTGTMIDATLVEADVKRPPMREGEVSTMDPAAGFTRRGQRSFFGYKAHLAVDHGTDLIRKAILTSADIGESIAADALICGDEAAVLADKAYESMARRDALAEAGITDRIMHRRHADKKSPSWHKWMNVAVAPLRGQIEKLFGTMKRHYLYRRVRYRSLERNRCQLWLLCTAMNLRRADHLTA
jgi:transposase, IS5 family